MECLKYFKRVVCLFEETIINDANKSRLINLVFPNIYVISLYEDANIIRSSYSSIVMRNLGANYTLLNMRRPSDEEYLEYIKFNESTNGKHTKLSKNELGCVISHAWVLGKIISSSNKNLSLILEDDIMPIHNFEFMIKKIIEETTIIENGKLWMLSHIDYFFDNRIRENEKFIPKSQQGRVYGAGAYAINIEVAKELEKLLHSLEKPADHYFIEIFESINSFDEGFVCSPPLFFCDFSQSTIGNERTIYTDYYYEKLTKCFKNVNLDNYDFFPLSLLEKKDDLLVVKNALKNPSFCIKRHIQPELCLNYYSSMDSISEEINRDEIETLHLNKELYEALKRSSWSKTDFIELYDKISPNSILISPPGDLAVCLAFYNPANRKRPLQNFLYCYLKIKNAGVPIYIIELTYEGREPELLNIPNTFQVKSNSYLFHKDNLWNILEKKVPDIYTKLLYLDGDILFKETNWALEISSLLDKYDLVQPYKLVKQLGIEYKNNINYISYMKAYESRGEEVLSNKYSHPSTGYCFAIRRGWVKQIGFIGMAVLGGGDYLICSFMSNIDLTNYSAHLFRNLPYVHKEYNYLKTKLSNANFKYGCGNLIIEHLYHGTHKNRQYATRSELIKTLTEEDFQINSDGVIEFKEPEKWNPIMLKYFTDRDDDSI